MSFLAGRLAAIEGTYFLQESKRAVTRIVQTQKNITEPSDAIKIAGVNNETPSPDVLPEILRHSLPSKIFNSSSETSNTSSFSKASKWALQSDPGSNNRSFVSDAINPLRAYASLPQVTFGAKRWQPPNLQNSVVASTANDLRTDKYTPMNAEKLKAVAAGLSQIGAGFAIATAIVFGGASLVFGLLASKLEFHNTDDIRTKGKDLLQPRFETYREHLAPLRNWAEEVSKKWHFEREEYVKERSLIKELSRTLGSKTSS